jgi:hypothetical protein
MPPVRRVLSAEQVEGLASAFRERFAPSRAGALDIEEIVEHDLKVLVVPKKGICGRLRKKAWLSSDGTRIIVDEAVMMGPLDEYRFLITEELAHQQLHGYLLPDRAFANEMEFRRWHRGITPEMEHWLEWQARTWAGRVLVPRAELLTVFRGAVRDARKLFRTFVLSEVAQLYVENSVAAWFGVSAACAHVRIDQDGLWRLASEGRALAAGEQGGAWMS